MIERDQRAERRMMLSLREGEWIKKKLCDLSLSRHSFGDGGRLSGEIDIFPFFGGDR
jgi:hypothetical protein